MITVSARVPEGLKKELDKYREKERLGKSVALRKLVSEGLKRWKKKRALKLLKEGKISFLKAAEVADMNVWEFSSLVKKEKITWIKSEKIKKDIKAV